MQGVFELRYQVYCVEREFLPAADYPDGVETDEFDPSSTHFCEFDVCGDVAGYARLVRPGQNQKFPFQQHCTELLDDVALPDPSASAEVSRLILRDTHRRPRASSRVSTMGNNADAHTSSGRASRSSTILPKLYRQMVNYSLATGIRYWYAAMERPLARSLVHMNYPFRQVTPQVDYYGPVATYVLDMNELRDHLVCRNPGHMAWLFDSGSDAMPGTFPPVVAPHHVRHAPEVRLSQNEMQLPEMHIGVQVNRPMAAGIGL